MAATAREHTAGWQQASVRAASVKHFIIHALCHLHAYCAPGGQSLLEADAGNSAALDMEACAAQTHLATLVCQQLMNVVTEDIFNLPLDSSVIENCGWENELCSRLEHIGTGVGGEVYCSERNLLKISRAVPKGSIHAPESSTAI